MRTFLFSLLFIFGLHLTSAPGQESGLPTSEGPAKPVAGATAANGTAASAKPSEPTVVTSEQFNLDMANHKGKFIGHVEVVGTDFHLTSEDMDVTFTPENKVERLIAHGHVVIVQPDRITHAGTADYFLPDKVIVLTQEPEVIDKGDHVRGIKITIHRDTNRMEVDGKVNVILPKGADEVSTPGPTPATPTTDSEKAK